MLSLPESIGHDYDEHEPHYKKDLLPLRIVCKRWDTIVKGLLNHFSVSPCDLEEILKDIPAGICINHLKVVMPLKTCDPLVALPSVNWTALPFHLISITLKNVRLQQGGAEFLLLKSLRFLKLYRVKLHYLPYLPKLEVLHLAFSPSVLADISLERKTFAETTPRLVELRINQHQLLSPQTASVSDKNYYVAGEKARATQVLSTLPSGLRSLNLSNYYPGQNIIGSHYRAPVKIYKEMTRFTSLQFIGPEAFKISDSRLLLPQLHALKRLCINTTDVPSLLNLPENLTPAQVEKACTNLATITESGSGIKSHLPSNIEHLHLSSPDLIVDKDLLKLIPFLLPTCSKLTSLALFSLDCDYDKILAPVSHQLLTLTITYPRKTVQLPLMKNLTYLSIEQRGNVNEKDDMLPLRHLPALKKLTLLADHTLDLIGCSDFESSESLANQSSSSFLPQLTYMKVRQYDQIKKLLSYQVQIARVDITCMYDGRNRNHSFLSDTESKLSPVAADTIEKMIQNHPVTTLWIAHEEKYQRISDSGFTLCIL